MIFTRRNIGLIVVGFLALLAILYISIGHQKPHMILPQGEQHVSGILKPIPLSATIRGTHILEVDGKPLSFVESESTSLLPFEGLPVTVTGTFEENIDTDLLPVLIATDIRMKALALKQWNQKALGITVSVPEVWSGEESSDELAFTSAGSPGYALTINKDLSDELPSGTAFTVSGKRAVRIQQDDMETVYIEKSLGTILVLAFRYSPAGVRKEQEYVFRQVIVPSLQFTATVTSSSARSLSGSAGSVGSAQSAGGSLSAASSMGAQPCGGPAGILCPKGQYCEVTDHVSDIGKCKSVR